MHVANQKGNVITYVVIAMSMIAALALGALYMTSSSAISELGANNANRAYFLALAGKDYALIKNIENTAGKTFTLRDQSGQILAGNDKFQLVISGDNLESTGIVKEGMPFEARRKISITKYGFSRMADVSFAKDIQSFTAPVQSKTDFITTDINRARISLGQIGITNGFGALWYRGGAIQGNCVNGKCDFGTGFRAFFVFQFGTGSTGNGVTFTFFNGDGVDANGVKNDINSVGGDSGRGELLGYAGDSRIDAGGTSFLDGKGGRGIQPPKVALEFDPYSNCCSAPPCSSCIDNVCANYSRYDGDYNHMAYVFWGDTTTFCGSTIGKNTHDDNKHGAGTGGPTDPENARSFRNTGGMDTTSYFNGSASGWQTDWLLNNMPTNIYALRIEVTRSTMPNVSGNYEYTVKSWIKQCLVNDIACPTYDDSSIYSNTKINYNDAVPADTPTLSRSFALSPAYHQDFNSFYFGWTAATGGATQSVTISRFRINFSK